MFLDTCQQVFPKNLWADQISKCNFYVVCSNKFLLHKKKQKPKQKNQQKNRWVGMSDSEGASETEQD